MGNRARITIGLGTSLHGTRYNSFVRGWWDSVKTLKIQPDSIWFSHDAANKELVLSEIPEEYRAITNVIEVEGEYSDFRLAIQKNQTTDWFSICGIDDRYLPEAFDEVALADEAGCDIVVDKMRLKHDGSILEGSWDPARMPYHITCPGSATLKKSLFDKTKGITKGSIFDDWELYIRCVAAGAKPYHASTIRAVHDLGYDHETLSGVNRNQQQDAEGREHIARVRQELGF